MEVKVYQTSGKETDRKAQLVDSIYAIEPNDHAIYLDVKQIQANKRQGTHSAKEVSQLSGSTKKLYRQKGTGNARRGHIKSPLLRGGARVFGPRPRNYSIKLNKKVKRLARKSALTYKAQENAIMVLENFAFEAPKTKDFINVLKNLGVQDTKCLMVIPASDNNLTLSVRNIQNANVVTADSINTYDILRTKKLILCEGALPVIEEMFNK
jgi:large subunit ribosomal protein L4